MGIYTINCPSCKKQMQWFCGNLDQLCDECKTIPAAALITAQDGMNALKQQLSEEPTKEIIMTAEKELIDTLKSLISAKDDLISHLKAEVERLKASQIVINQPTPVLQPPYVNPIYPGVGQPYQPPFNPYGPLTPPYIVTSGDLPGPIGGEGFISTQPMPPGSVQSSPRFTVSNADGMTSIISSNGIASVNLESA